jgi:hypothetical protein
LCSQLLTYLSARSHRRTLTDIEIQTCALKVKDLKEALYEGIPLAEYDPALPLQLATDASRLGLAGVLFQDIHVEEKELPESKLSAPVSSEEGRASESLEEHSGTGGEDQVIHRPVKVYRPDAEPTERYALDTTVPVDNRNVGDNVPILYHPFEQKGKRHRPREFVVLTCTCTQELFGLL